MMSWVLRQCLYDSDHVLQTHENMCYHTLRNDTIILSSDIAVQKFAHNLDVDLATVKSTLTAVEVVVIVPLVEEEVVVLVVIFAVSWLVDSSDLCNAFS